VIVFRFPRDPSQEFIKRVVGLPGDKVTIARGVVSINGQEMNEEYIAAPPGTRVNGLFLQGRFLSWG